MVLRAGTTLAVLVPLALALFAGCDDSERLQREREQQAAAAAAREKYFRAHPELATARAAETRRRSEEQAARQRVVAQCVLAQRGSRSPLQPGFVSDQAKVSAVLTEGDSHEPGDVSRYENALSHLRAGGQTATHVICLAEKRVTVETCNYRSRRGEYRIDRTQAKLDITVVDLQTKKAAFVVLNGPGPEACPHSLGRGASATSTLDGARVTDEAFREAVLGPQRSWRLKKEAGTASATAAAIAARVRWASGLSDQGQLQSVARDPVPEVRIAAIRKLTGRPLLEELRDTDAEAAVRQAAEERLRALGSR